jgi:prephenate dehydratase
MVKKIHDRKIEHKPNTETFFLDCDNLIKKQNKTKPIMKLNSQLTQYL